MRARSVVYTVCCIVSLVLSLAFVSAGFEQEQYVSGINFPTSMAFLPDGRILVAEQQGDLRVISADGALLQTPFLSLDLGYDPNDNEYDDYEKGLLGVAVDPQWTSGQQYVYVYYTIPASQQHRVSRFRALSGNTNVADPSFTEDILLSPIGDVTDGNVHNGGSMQFGPDGKLYVVMGDSFVPADSQDISNLKGTIMRINKDGTIPSDNPFNGPNERKEIWSYGLRNPFTFAIDPTSGAIMINDVGLDDWEEVNYLAPGESGINFGWPNCEGPKNEPPNNCASTQYRYPVYAYPHADSQGALIGESITGGVFYYGDNFPGSYEGDYFFGDYVGGWIRRINKDNFEDVTVFIDDAKSPIDIDIHPVTKEMYYLEWAFSRDGSAIHRVWYESDGTEPTARFTADPESGTVPLTVSFDASDSSDAQTQVTSFSWDFGDGSTGSGQTAQHTYTAIGDYTVTLTVTDTDGLSDTQQKTIEVAFPAQTQLTITSPAPNAKFVGGQTVEFVGEATNAPPGTEFFWQVNLHHNDLGGSHVHPTRLPTEGSSGTVVIPTDDHVDPDIWYSFVFSADQPDGSHAEIVQNIFPEETTITVTTSPPGLQVTVDGIPRTTPFTAPTIVGMQRTISVDEVVSTSSGEIYEFVSWSDGGQATHTVTATSSPSTFAATFQNAQTGETFPGFANPIPSFTLNPETVAFIGSQETAQLSVAVSNDATWKYGYVSFNGAPWTQFEFEGTKDENWVRGSATKDVSVAFSSVQTSSDWNFVAVYSCTKGDPIWDCQDRKWQIKQFSTDTSEATPDGPEPTGNVYSCTDNSLIGDVTGDLQVSFADSVAINEHLAGLADLGFNRCCIDVNDDGQITAADATLIEQYLDAEYQGNIGVKCSVADDLGTTGDPLPQCSGDVCNIPSATGAVILNPGDNIGSKAASNPEGTLFILNPGVYREQSVAPKKNQKFYGRPGAIMNGARKLTGWTQEGNKWWASIPAQHAEVFAQRANSCDHDISKLCHIAEDVFFDDKPGTQVGTKGEVTGFKYYIDYGANRAYIAQNPNNFDDIEVSYIERAFVGPGDNVVIRGLTVEKYAPINQEGAIDTRKARGTHLNPNGNGNNWIIEQNTLSHHHGSAAVFFSGTQFRDNYVHTNGVVGIKPMWAAGATIEGNEFAYNSYAGVRSSWESGGLKSLWSDDLKIVQNYAHDNRGYGLWTDTDVYRALYDGNLVFRNMNRGIAEEVDFDATIINNVVKFNGFDSKDGGWMGAPQILIQNSEGAVVKDNVVTVGTEKLSGAGPMGILVVQGDRSDQDDCCGGEQDNYFSRNNDISNNDITYMGSIGNTGAIWSAFGAQATNNKFTNNKIHIANTGANVFAWETKGLNFNTWQSKSDVSGNTIDTNIQQQSGFARPAVTLTRPNIKTLSNDEPVLLSADISGLQFGDHVGVVIFYLDGVEIARTSHDPYEVYWYYPTPGTYTLTAKAITVHDEHESTSAGFTVTVQ